MDNNLLKKLTDEKRSLMNMIAEAEMKHLTNKHIMVIDDSEETIFLMSTYLKKIGENQIMTFTNEFDALQEITKRPPDLIILDIILKNTSGINLAKAIKSLDIFHGPIIFISSNSNYKRELNEVFGTNTPFFTKPIDKTKFTELMQILLK